MRQIPILRAAVAGRGIESMINECLDGLLAFANDHSAGRCEDLGQSPQNRPRIAFFGEPLAVFHLVLGKYLSTFAVLDPLDAVDFIQHSAAFIAVLVRRHDCARRGRRSHPLEVVPGAVLALLQAEFGV